MLTLGLAAVESFGNANFFWMYFATFVLDMGIINIVGYKLTGKEIFN